MFLTFSQRVALNWDCIIFPMSPRLQFRFKTNGKITDHHLKMSSWKINPTWLTKGACPWPLFTNLSPIQKLYIPTAAVREIIVSFSINLGLETMSSVVVPRPAAWALLCLLRFISTNYCTSIIVLRTNHWTMKSIRNR